MSVAKRQASGHVGINMIIAIATPMIAARDTDMGTATPISTVQIHHFRLRGRSTVVA